MAERTEISVMVGNGDRIKCQGECLGIKLHMQGADFTLSTLVLPIQGADLVLGVQWLQELGLVLARFAEPSMQFKHNGKWVCLRGEPRITEISSNHLQRMLKTGAIDSVHSVSYSSLNKCLPHPIRATGTTTMTLQGLLDEFEEIFTTPTTLPPNRVHDHHIHLLPNSNPVNVKPYRYPHYQKEIMTEMIQEMLKEGIIRGSSSPYSSPVLLVRKKDGTWRFCVDYRALNAITIRDRFPIPTVDELLDEMHGATVFTKLDLRSGYHQIRVAKDDIHKTAFRTVDGHYEFVVMPFGLSNAPSTFQSAMNDLFRGFLRKFVLVFLMIY